MTLPRAAQACVLLFASLIGRTATATTSRFELAWRSPSSAHPCITEAELKRAVSTRLGRDPFVPAGQGEIVIDGQELAAAPGHLRAHITQRDSEGHILGGRDLDATSCEELRRSAAFVVFLIVDPEAALGGGPPPSPASPKNDENGPRPAPPERRPTNDPPSAGTGRRPLSVDDPGKHPDDHRARPAPPAPARVRVDLGLALVVSNGLLPKPDVAPAVALGVELPTLPLRFEWRAAYRIPSRGVDGNDFRAVEQSWRACYFPRIFGPLFGAACGGATWAAILPETRGLARGDQAPKNVVGPLLALGPTIELGAARVFADLSLALPRPRYAFFFLEEGRPTTLYELSHVVWSLSIGATRSFW